MNYLWTKCMAFACLALLTLQASAKALFPDGSPIPDWFRHTEVVKLAD